MEFVVAGSWDYSGGGLFEGHMAESLRVGHGSHGPLGSLVVAVLVVSAGSWELDSIQLDIAPRGGHLL